MAPPVVVPPATRTRPSASVTEMWFRRAVVMEVAAEKEPEVVNHSAVKTGPLPLEPPVTRIRPSGSRVAEAPARTWAIESVDAQDPLWGALRVDLVSTSGAKNMLAASNAVATMVDLWLTTLLRLNMSNISFGRL